MSHKFQSNNESSGDDGTDLPTLSHPPRSSCNRRLTPAVSRNSVSDMCQRMTKPKPPVSDARELQENDGMQENNNTMEVEFPSQSGSPRKRKHSRPEQMMMMTNNRESKHPGSGPDAPPTTKRPNKAHRQEFSVCFPCTIDTHRGLCLNPAIPPTNGSKHKIKATAKGSSGGTDDDADDFDDGHTDDPTQLWNSNFAATSAAQHTGFAFTMGRLLGTITRTLHVRHQKEVDQHTQNVMVSSTATSTNHTVGTKTKRPGRGGSRRRNQHPRNFIPPFRPAVSSFMKKQLDQSERRNKKKSEISTSDNGNRSFSAIITTSTRSVATTTEKMFPTRQSVMKEVRRELQNDFHLEQCKRRQQCSEKSVIDDASVDTTAIQTRANQMQQTWKQIQKNYASSSSSLWLSRSRTIRKRKKANDAISEFANNWGGDCGWDAAHGHLDPDRLELPKNSNCDYIPVVALLRYLQSNSMEWTELPSDENHTQIQGAPKFAVLYGGLRRIPIDILSVLDALREMTCPVGMYTVPLLIAIPIVTTTLISSTFPSILASPSSLPYKTEVVQYQIKIGVYAHRLLPEVMTQRDLHIVMSALDNGSYQVTAPLQLPPMPPPNEPHVFASATSPQVLVDVDNSQKGDDKQRSGGQHGKMEDHFTTALTSRGKSKRKENSRAHASIKNSEDLNNTIDLTIQDSTRDESTISAFTVPGLMKLLENTGNDVSNWPNIEAKLEGKFRLHLMLHQRHAICWMVQMESLQGAFGINSILWEERQFGDPSIPSSSAACQSRQGKYYYSPALGQIRLDPPPFMRGGLLCDEMGLGKTCQVLGLIMATLEDCRAEALNAEMSLPADGIPPTHATLIIVPSALVTQWLAEIDKATTDNSVVVDFFDARTKTFERGGRQNNNANVERVADIVVTTYTALERPGELAEVSWGRIVLDEMQEIRSSSTSIARNCEKLWCQGRRWMLSGTPLFEGVADLRGELNFLSLEPFCAKSEDGFFNFAILDHWNNHSAPGLETLRVLGLLMLRRSKTMTIAETGQPLMGLKPLTVQFVPVPQHPSERALYCFLEHIVAREMTNVGQTTKDGVARRLCLRLLREMCISPVLLSGGMGVSSQLNHLNNLLVRENRRSLERHRSSRDDGTTNDSIRTFSCNEAIRYLSQVQEVINTDDDFVSGMTLGTGGGMAQRNRAAESPEQKFAEARERLAQADRAVRNEISRRARARWHWALEGVTTGQYREYSRSTQKKFLHLWFWRGAVLHRWRPDQVSSTGALPWVLRRGWRPCRDFVNKLREAHPEYAWVHPATVQMKNIPSEVELEEVKAALKTAIMKTDKGIDDNDTGKRISDGGIQVIPNKQQKGPSWDAFVTFASLEDAKHVASKAALAEGISLPCRANIFTVVQAAADAQLALGQAKAEQEIYPTHNGREKLRKARAVFRLAKLGLRIVAGNRDESLAHNVVLSRALGVIRTYDKTENDDTGTTNYLFEGQELLARSVALKKEAEADVRHYQHAKDIPDEVKMMSAYESLQALSDKEYDNTYCIICMGSLGCTKSDDVSDKCGMITLTSCGHLFCEECFVGYRRSRAENHVPCPTCRKPLDTQDKTTRVDPNITADEEDMELKRSLARATIKEVAAMLEKSNGQLDAKMWETLYLSFDLPGHVPKNGNFRFTAVPKEVLQHLRAATEMEVKSNPSSSGRISSKISALLNDLSTLAAATGERSVVFSSSLLAIRHLLFCFRARGWGHQALYTGQKLEEQQLALQAWKVPNTSVPILVVQSGAAASGLTLTAACKMFLLEPFGRLEEEKQAYARCHRYGQVHPVHVKCYYTPVSVESRLLEWRRNKKRSKSSTTTTKCHTSANGVEEELVDATTTVKFATMDDDDDDNDDDDVDMTTEHEEANNAENSTGDGGAEGEDVNQTFFLLGLS